MTSTALSPDESFRRAFFPFRDRLINIYAAMDEAYRKVADNLGFVCRECEDSCCRSRFYHHTHIEYLYLLEGSDRLEPARRLAVRRDAAKVHQQDLLKKNGSSHREMCPLNLDGRCDLYAYRPMICRLHGIPHKLLRPGQDTLCGPGCETFERIIGLQRDDVHLDRTPFYGQMAELEMTFKKATGLFRKPKQTIAEMFISYDPL